MPEKATRVLSSFLATCLLASAASPARSQTAPHDKPGHWIVITAPDLREELRPLENARAAEGFDVTVLQTTDLLTALELQRHDGRKILAKVRDLWKDQPEKSYVLLIGTIVAGPTGLRTVVPALPGTTGRMARLPTDDPYGCKDGDVFPIVPVGRLPARTPEELRGMIKKTLAFEQDGRVDGTGAAPANWRRSMTLLVGSPGGESTAEKLLGDWYVNTATPALLGQMSAVWNVRTVFHVPSSPWYVTDGQLHDQSLAFLKEGQTFIVHSGHSSPDGFWSEGAKFLDRTDWQQVIIPHGGGVFMTCGCWACQWDPQGRADHEGFGIAAVRNPSGPVAVIGATAESYSVAGYLAFNGLLTALSKPALPERLGQAWLDVQKGIASAPVGYLTWQMFDYGDGSNGKIPLDIQRKEHAEMWTLLGDPAMRLPEIAPELQLAADPTAAPGGTLKITGKLPPGMPTAKVRIVLERPLGATPAGLASIPAKAGPEQDKVIMANFQKAQISTLAEAEAAVKQGAFETDINVPKDAENELVVRALATDSKKEAMDVTSIKIAKAK